MKFKIIKNNLLSLILVIALICLGAVFAGNVIVKEGNLFSGQIDVQNNKIVNVSDPTNAQDAATKNYVDNNKGDEYVDRGDPSSYDFTQADITQDGYYHDLNLSSIVPAGAKAVILKVSINDETANNQVLFRKNGNINNYNAVAIRLQVANQQLEFQLTVPCDSNRVIEVATSPNMSLIQITVVGWFI